jgi:hypothetical protein
MSKKALSKACVRSRAAILAILAAILLIIASLSNPCLAITPSTASHSRSSNVGVVPNTVGGGWAGILPEASLNTLAASPPTGIPPGPGFNFIDVDPSTVTSVSDLTPYDTLIFWQFDPGAAPAAFQSAVLDWLVSTAGKILIWDSNTYGTLGLGPANYTFLSSVGANFTTAGPGSTGYTGGTLVVVEETNFTSGIATSPFYIDNASLASSTDALGDENVMVTQSPSWCALQNGTNAIGFSGFVTAYTSLGSINGSGALIVYSGLDTNYVDFGAGVEMTKMIFFELIHGWGPPGSPEVSDLHCTTPVSGAKISVSKFFTDSCLRLLPLDSKGNPKVDVILSRGRVISTNPVEVLAWVNVTNTLTIALQSLQVNETLPADWTVCPLWFGAIHVYFANATSLWMMREITQCSMITVFKGNPQVVHLAIPNFNATAIRHPLMPGQSILLSVKMTYALKCTCQSAASYPRNYTDTAYAAATCSLCHQFTGSATAFFTAYAKVTCGCGP